MSAEKSCVSHILCDWEREKATGRYKSNNIVRNVNCYNKHAFRSGKINAQVTVLFSFYFEPVAISVAVRKPPVKACARGAIVS